MNIQPRTRRERVIYRMAEILADKLAHAHNCEMSSGLLMTASEIQAEDEIPPPPPRRNPVAMCGPRIVVNGVFAGPRPEDL